MDLYKTEFLYVGDPLCSWCWGISEELQKLKDAYEGEIPFQVIVGGLRPYEEHPMNASLKRSLRQHWEQVEKLSGRPIRYDLLKDGVVFVYNTEKPCRAVVTVRNMLPEATFPFFKAVQEAFYFHNRDTNLLETYDPLLDRFALDRDHFRELFQREEIRKETHDDFMWAKQVGVKGFPAVLLKHAGQIFALALGFSTFESMDKICRAILAGKGPGEE